MVVRKHMLVNISKVSLKDQSDVKKLYATTVLMSASIVYDGVEDETMTNESVLHHLEILKCSIMMLESAINIDETMKEPSPAEPKLPKIGDVYYDEKTGKLHEFNGKFWTVTEAEV